MILAPCKWNWIERYIHLMFAAVIKLCNFSTDFLFISFEYFAEIFTANIHQTFICFHTLLDFYANLGLFNKKCSDHLGNIHLFVSFDFAVFAFALYLSIFVRRTCRNAFVLLTIFSNLWREKKLGTPSVCENPLTPTCQQKEGITVNSLILRFNDMFACSNITFQFVLC